MIRQTINRLKSDCAFRICFFTFLSTLITLIYAIYNGVLGITKLSVWNCSICVYYLSLLFIKLILMFGQRNETDRKRRDVYILISYFFLIVIAVSMVVPLILMINNQRSYDFGLIPAIAMAAYTTYSITMAIVNYRKANKNDNQIVKQVRLINVISAMMSIAILQNTMIIVNDGFNAEMKILSIVTGFAIISSITVLIIISFVKFIK